MPAQGNALKVVPEHMMLGHSVLDCTCGAWLYEDSFGHVYCATWGRIARYKSPSDIARGR